MTVFWKNGFSETSVEDLVAATGIGRVAIHSDFDGKDDLFLGCLSAHRKRHVKPALNLLLSGDGKLSKSELAEVAGFLATAIQGLWSFAPCSTDITQLEGFRAALIKLLKARLEQSNM